MSPRPVALVALAGLLAGCSLAPPYSPPAVSIPVAYAHLDGWALAKPADNLSRGPWWERFSDTTLNGLETQVESQNPELAAALARYDEARDFTDQARAGLLPAVSLGATTTANQQSEHRPLRTGGPNDYGDNQVGATIGYEFDFWGKIRNEIASRKALAQGSAADAATMRLSLQAELATDYFMLRGLDSQAQLLRDTVAAYSKAYDLTDTLYQGKVGAMADVSRAQTQLSTAKAQLSDVMAARALLEHAIAALIGKPASDFSLAPAIGVLEPPAAPLELPSTLLQRRPDIASAERAVFAANSEIGVAKAAFFPTISLGGVGGWQASAGNVLTAANLFWSLGPNISLPLFQGGLLKAREKQAYAVFNEATDNYRTVVLTAFREVEDARAQLSWLGEEQQDTGQAATAAQTTLDVALTLYRDGATDYLNVVTAQTALLQSQQSDLQLKTRRLVADVGLIRALGGGWTVADVPLPDWTAAAAAARPGAPSPTESASLQTAKEPQ